MTVEKWSGGDDFCSGFRFRDGFNSLEGLSEVKWIAGVD